MPLLEPAVTKTGDYFALSSNTASPSGRNLSLTVYKTTIVFLSTSSR
jgi:hypothetical protein